MHGYFLGNSNCKPGGLAHIDLGSWNQCPNRMHRQRNYKYYLCNWWECDRSDSDGTASRSDQQHRCGCFNYFRDTDSERYVHRDDDWWNMCCGDSDRNDYSNDGSDNYFDFGCGHQRSNSLHKYGDHQYSVYGRRERDGCECFGHITNGGNRLVCCRKIYDYWYTECFWRV